MQEAGDPRLIDALRGVQPFRDAPDEVLNRLAGAVRWRRYRRGEVVFREGAPVEALFLLRSGRVRVVTYGKDGREHTFRILEPGELFPHAGLVGGGGYPATAEVLEDAVLGVVTRQAVLDLAATDGRVALALLRDLEDKIRVLQDKIRALALQDLRSRVLHVLMQHVGEHLTHQEIASIVGAARESVSRVIADFKRRGWVTEEATGGMRVRRMPGGPGEPPSP